MNTLKEIKSGNTGYGLLVENDGYISMNEGKNKDLVESYKLNESFNGEFRCPYPFIVNAVFQKFGVKNANGRIYPEEVLKKEVEKYQQAIVEKRAYGECYTPEVNVLTENGWKQMKDIKEGDNILTLNTSLNIFEYKPVLRKIEYDYKGIMYRVKTENINDLVTPNHEYPIYKHDKFDKFISVSEMYNLDEVFTLPSSKEDILDNQILFSKKDITIEDYDGVVMCVEVENHTFYVESNGFEHWTKNCNHPDSTAIDVGRICLNITELHWEGRTLVGQMEIPITEAFRRTGAITCLADQVAHFLLSGLKLGVSSRGIGNVEQKYGSTIVTEYELICWDLVSQPSTPGAWIGDSIEELQPYMESTNKNKSKLLIDLNKFEDWLK